MKDFLGLLTFSFKGGQTHFTTMHSVIDVEKGVGKIRTLEIAAPEAIIEGTGKINLPSYNLNVTTVVRFVKSPKFPPFSVKFYGPLDKPKRDFVTKELQSYLLSNVFSNVVQGLLNKKEGAKGIIKGLLDFGGGDQQSTDTPSQQQPDVQGQPEPKTQQRQPDAAQEQPQDLIKRPDKALKSILKGLL